MKKLDTAIIKLWGNIIGAVSWLDDHAYAVFEFDPDFLIKGLDVSPLHMGLENARKSDGKFSFPALNKNTFLGLPGLLADALPDKFGNNIIDAWLARNGRDSASFSPVERLCYMGKRGVGALEFEPSTIGKYDESVPIEVAELVTLAQEIMNEHKGLNVNLSGSKKEKAEAILDILRVGTSAGGARAKAVIAIDKNNRIMSGQAEASAAFDYWILKFDGVSDLELGEARSYGRIEYAYHLMAKAAGINMSECRLLEENGRAHFMTKRFDRINGKKLHLQSLCGIAHYDFNMAGDYSYEQAFTVMRRLRLSKVEASEQYRRMVFNIVARNLDDHTKNISFLMGPDGKWKLSPAYDVIYAHNPAGKWTNQHQMSVNGKRDNISRKDLVTVGESISLSKTEDIVSDVITAVKRWPEFAQEANLKKEIINEIKKHQRTDI